MNEGFDRTETTALLMKTWSDGEAEIVRQLLESSSIPCQVTSDITHSIYPFSVDGLGEIRIFVPGGRLEEAQALLAEYRRNGLEGLDGGQGEEGATEGRPDGSQDEPDGTLP